MEQQHRRGIPRRAVRPSGCAIKFTYPASGTNATVRSTIVIPAARKTATRMLHWLDPTVDSDAEHRLQVLAHRSAWVVPARCCRRAGCHSGTLVDEVRLVGSAVGAEVGKPHTSDPPAAEYVDRIERTGRSSCPEWCSGERLACELHSRLVRVGVTNARAGSALGTANRSRCV